MTASNARPAATDDLLAAVRTIIHDRLGIDPSAIAARSTFVELGIDSLDVVDIMLRLELRFHIAFVIDDYKTIDRIADLVAEIRTKLAAS